MKHIKHLFAVCLLLLVATTATAQSQSDNAQTKALSATKADVNGDGVVNEADIEEILAIMQQENGTKYYWYVGQDNPADLPENFNPEDQKVTDNSSPGWRYIGTSIPTYSASNKLWDGVTNGITFAARDIYYYAVPSSNIKIYDDTGASVMETFATSEAIIGGVKYYVYTSDSKARGIAWMVY